MKKKCLYCGKSFDKKNHESVKYWLTRKYCSSQCYFKTSKNYISLSKEQRVKNCLLCGKTIEMPINTGSHRWVKGYKYCKECIRLSPEYSEKRKFSCEKARIGGGGFKKGCVALSKGKSVSKEIRIKISAKLQGISVDKWKGFKRSQNSLDRVKFKDEVQKKVLERDNYTCQKCGVKSHVGLGKTVRLHVDHIQPWSEYIEGRFDMNNCRTLCQECHYEITFNKPMPKDSIRWGIPSLSVVQDF